MMTLSKTTFLKSCEVSCGEGIYSESFKCFRIIWNNVQYVSLQTPYLKYVPGTCNLNPAESCFHFYSDMYIQTLNADVSFFGVSSRIATNI